MKNPIIIGLVCAIVILIGCIAYNYFGNYKKAVEEAAYWRKEKFKTDTITLNNYYTTASQPEKYKEDVPPQTVYVYPEAPVNPSVKVEFDTAGFINVVDSIMKTRTQISRTYFTQFPKANKLLFSSLTKDTLTMDLLGIDGRIKREIYPIDLSLFKYQYVDNSLKTIQLSTRKTEKTTQKKIISYNGTYLNYQYDFLNKSTAAQINTGVDIWNFRLQGFANQPFNGGSNLEAGVRVGYRLF